MGFLIFAYRKLALKRKISDLQYREMVISMQKNLMTEKLNDASSIFASYNETMQNGMNDKMGRLMYNNRNVTGYNPYQDPDGRSILNQYYQEKQTASMAESQYMKQLKDKETSMDTQIANIDSQLKQLNAELQAVEKQEDEEAKQDAPKFGQGS